MNTKSHNKPVRCAVYTRKSTEEGLEQEYNSLESQATSSDEIRKLIGQLEDLWERVQPREQVRLTSLLVERVDFDGVGGNVGITFHDTGLEHLLANNGGESA